MTLVLVTSLALTAAALVGAVVLFVMTKRQAWHAARRLEQRQEEAMAVIEEIKTQFDDVLSKFRDLEERTGMLVAPAPVASGLNLSRRTQALRMLRRGDSVDDVAAALAMQRAEVDLLFKLEHIGRVAEDKPAGALPSAP